MYDSKHVEEHSVMVVFTFKLNPPGSLFVLANIHDPRTWDGRRQLTPEISNTLKINHLWSATENAADVLKEKKNHIMNGV